MQNDETHWRNPAAISFVIRAWDFLRISGFGFLVYDAA